MDYIYSLSNNRLLEQNSIGNVLPTNITIFKEKNNYMVKVSLSDESNQAQADYLVARELDRLAFLTGIDCSAKLERQQRADGRWNVTKSFTMKWNIENHIPDKLTLQVWKEPLSTQLALWRIANEESTPLPAKINLYFQIIEASFPDNRHYPEYNDPTIQPDPKTECRLLRNLVSHQGDNMMAQMKNYCEYIGYPYVNYDPSDIEFTNLIKSKLPIAREEAHKVIMSEVTIAS